MHESDCTVAQGLGVESKAYKSEGLKPEVGVRKNGLDLRMIVFAPGNAVVPGTFPRTTQLSIVVSSKQMSELVDLSSLSGHTMDCSRPGVKC